MNDKNIHIKKLEGYNRERSNSDITQIKKISSEEKDKKNLSTGNLSLNTQKSSWRYNKDGRFTFSPPSFLELLSEREITPSQYFELKKKEEEEEKQRKKFLKEEELKKNLVTQEEEDDGFKIEKIPLEEDNSNLKVTVKKEISTPPPSDDDEEDVNLVNNMEELNLNSQKIDFEDIFKN